MSRGYFANVISALVCAVLQQPAALAQHNHNDSCVGSPRSAVLAARNGGNRAYVETTAQHPKPKAGRNPDTACASRSKLFVSTSEGEFDLAFMQAPTLEWPGSQLKAIDWSPSGQYLLVDLFTYQYEGEGAGHFPVDLRCRFRTRLLARSVSLVQGPLWQGLWSKRFRRRVYFRRPRPPESGSSSPGPDSSTENASFMR
jgi:hypothetical protein